MKWPDKHPNLIDEIKLCVDLGKYLDTRHSSERQNERNISRPEIVYVLKHGHHEKKKDKFDTTFRAWNYAIRGKTLDKRELRIIISFDENGLLIITAIELR